ncbi:MAG: hypothetical protein V1699_05685 [Candidatus Omnitrophota bacterium]
MKTKVEFRSAKFPAYENEQDEINPGRWGKRIAEYLSSKLREKDITVGNIYLEDWGWAIPIEGQPVKMWIGCGNYEEYPDGFLCFIEPSKPIIKKLFKKIDITENIARISKAIEQIINADTEINSIKWWDEDEK